MMGANCAKLNPSLKKSRGTGNSISFGRVAKKLRTHGVVDVVDDDDVVVVVVAVIQIGDDKTGGVDVDFVVAVVVDETGRKRGDDDNEDEADSVIVAFDWNVEDG